MVSTPSNRLKLTPAGSPLLNKISKTPVRGRPTTESSTPSRIMLQRVVGTTCTSATGFDSIQSSFAYIAGGAAVVVDVNPNHHKKSYASRYIQRFYRARPAAVPVYAVNTQLTSSPSTPTATPKANDNRNRVSLGMRESGYGLSEYPESKTWTSRERIKAASCLALSREKKYLAVGESGYAPRVLIFGLQDSSSDTPLVSISEHSFGVKAVAWSQDTKFLASLGTSNDGFLYLWKIDPKTGSAKLFQQNRCTSSVKDMVWMGTNLITLGVRHVKAWKVEEQMNPSPVKPKFNQESIMPIPPQKTLPGRNVLLGSMIDSTFTCAAVVDDNQTIICSEAGDVCLLEDDGKQMKLQRVLRLDLSISSITIRDLTAYISGKTGQFTTLDVAKVVNFQDDSVLESTQAPNGIAAMGFLRNNFVTIDLNRSIEIWNRDYLPGQIKPDPSRILIPGYDEPIIGCQTMPQPNPHASDFLTWSGSGKMIQWDVDGQIRSTFEVPIDDVMTGPELDNENQLTVLKMTKGGSMIVTGDKVGVLKVIDLKTAQCLLDTKAHSSEVQDITIYEDSKTNKLIIATCGRDRTAQLFHKVGRNEIHHFQTLEFPAKVVQVLIPSNERIIACSLDRTLQLHDLVSRTNDPEDLAAVPSRMISLKASPTSMVMAKEPDCQTVYVSLLDRSVCQYDLGTGRLQNSFKCIDETGTDSTVLERLILDQTGGCEPERLLGVSNTDKSVRVYDAQTGGFLGREWGHTESINGLALIEVDDCELKAATVASDGTLMIWCVDTQDSSASGTSPESSPAKEAAAHRPPLRRVLSKAELAEYQKPTIASAGRRSPPRSLNRRTSRQFLTAAHAMNRTPQAQISSSESTMYDMPSKKGSSSTRDSSPPSPRRRVRHRPSLPTMGTATHKKSNPNLKSFGSLNMATEQACRMLRVYRKKLTSSEPINQVTLEELDQELRLTVSALSNRAIRSKALNESMLSGLLDEYSERLVSMLDEKLRLSFPSREDSHRSRSSDSMMGSEDSERPRTASGDSSSTLT